MQTWKKETSLKFTRKKHFITGKNYKLHLNFRYSNLKSTSTSLWVAAVANHLPVVKLLVRLGANMNAQSDSGSTAVRSACFMTNVEVGECKGRLTCKVDKNQLTSNFTYSL